MVLENDNKETCQTSNLNGEINNDSHCRKKKIHKQTTHKSIFDSQAEEGMCENIQLVSWATHVPDFRSSPMI